MKDLAIEIDRSPIKPVGFKTSAGFGGAVRVTVGAPEDDDDDYDDD